MAIFNSYVKLSEGRHIHLIPFVCFCRLTSCETTRSAMKTTGKGEHRCGKPMGWLGGNEIDYTIIYYFDIVILGELMSLGWLYGIYIYIYMILWYTTWLYTNMYSHIIKSHTIPTTWLLSLHNPPSLGKSWDFNSWRARSGMFQRCQGKMTQHIQFARYVGDLSIELISITCNFPQFHSIQVKSHHVTAENDLTISSHYFAANIPHGSHMFLQSAPGKTSQCSSRKVGWCGIFMGFSYLVGGDWNHGISWLFIDWECHNPI